MSSYYEQNKEKHKKRSREWKKRNPDKVKQYQQNYKDKNLRETGVSYGNKEGRRKRRKERKELQKQDCLAHLATLPVEEELRLLRAHIAAPGSRDIVEPMIVSLLLIEGCEVQYNRPPLPDITVKYKYHTFYVEIKRLYSTLSDTQIEAFSKLDYPVYIVRLKSDVERIMNDLL